MIKNPERYKQFEVAFYSKLRRLPTLESQTVECFRILQEFGVEFIRPFTWNNIDLRRGGFCLYARSGFWKHNQQPLFGFAIVNIEIPPRYCGRGWFRNFSEIVYHTMPHDLLVVENVSHDELNQALQRKPDYHQFRVDWFARSEWFSIEGFDPRYLRASTFREFQQLGGRIKWQDFSPAVTKFPGYRPSLTNGAVIRESAENKSDQFRRPLAD